MKTMLPVLFFTLFCAPAFAGSPTSAFVDFNAYDDTYSDLDTVGCLTKTAYFQDDSFFTGGEGVISYLWDFGDGATSTDDYQTTHTYTSPGLYTVTFTIQTNKGKTYVVTKNQYIKVGSNFSVNLGSDISTCIGSSVPLDAATSGATYLWSEGSTTSGISTLLSGKVSVVVTKYGCVAKDTVQITRTPLLKAGFTYVAAGGCSPIKTDFTQTSVVCGGTIVSSAWDFGDDSTSAVANPSHEYLSPGAYNVRLIVTKDDGTKDTATIPVTITGTQTPLVELGPDQDLCDGGTLTLSGGNAGADILWSTGDNTPDITVWDGGEYSVVVTNNGCSAYDTVNITWKPELVLNFGAAKVSGCLPVVMKFTDSSTACTGSIVGWSWDFGDGGTSTQQNPVHTFTSKGQFPVKLIVTASSGSTLSKTKKVDINPPTILVDLGADTTICFGESLILDAGNSGAVYTWSTGENTQQVTVSDDGAYSVSVDLGGCVARDTINVITSVSAASNFGYAVAGNCLPVSVSFSDSSTAFCGQSIVSWKWNFGDGTSSTQRNPVHIYNTADSFNVKLTVTASGGTTSTRTRKVTVSNTTFNVDLPAAIKVCRGGSAPLDAVVTGAQYSWTPVLGLTDSNIRNPVLTPVTAGWYAVAVTKCGVVLKDSVMITMDSIAKPSIVQDGNSLKAPDAVAYEWYYEGKVISGAAAKNIRVDKAGNYMVKITNGNNCVSQSDAFFYIPVSGDEKPGPGGFVMKISPNPAKGKFNILLSQIPAKTAIVSVYDAAGKRLLVTNIHEHVNPIDATKFLKGLYFVEIIIGTDRTIMPVVIQ